MELTENEVQLVLKRVVSLGDKKEVITADDLPFIIADVLGTGLEQPVAILDFKVKHDAGHKPEMTVTLTIDGKKHTNSSQGDGEYDGLLKACRKIFAELDHTLPQLQDYNVRIPHGGKSDALVETVISWEGNFKTKGLDTDQLVSAIKATEKMLNRIYTNK